MPVWRIEYETSSGHIESIKPAVPPNGGTYFQSGEIEGLDFIEVESDSVKTIFGGPSFIHLFLVKDKRLVQDLDSAKQTRYDEIDARTRQLIGQGFQFEEVKLSLSLAAQSTLAGLDQARESLSYPVLLSDVDNSNTLSIPDADTMHRVFIAAVSSYRGALEEGTKLKSAVQGAATPDAVNAVHDQR